MGKPAATIALIALGLALGYNYYYSYDYVHVKVDKGILRGFRSTTWRGTPYSIFKGIPYAKPPVGGLRFKSPQEESAWAGVRDAVSHGSMCPQVLMTTFGIIMGHEDCLFLNVYTPSVEAERLPVMVWVHGGAFELGSGNHIYYGPDYFIDSGVVFITLNYRLSALGFLSSGDHAAPGNAGLKDQVAALRWIRRNIAKFGGDPDNVTLLGESAGAACVHYHLLSPLSSGLFVRAIIQSASTLNSWTLTEDGPAAMMKLVEDLGAKDINSDLTKALKFLKNVPYEKIVRAQTVILAEMEEKNGETNLFLPTVEKGIKTEEMFLPDLPLNILQSGKFNKVPCIIGYTSHEGYLFINALRNPAIRDSTVEYVERFIPNDIKNKKFRTNLAESVRKFYFNDQPIGPENISNLVNLYSDVSFTAGINRATKLQLESTTNPIYYYVFSYDGGLNFLKWFFNIDLPGAAHGDDMGYLFYSELVFWRKPRINSDDEYVLNTLTKMWTNFGKHGNPTPTGDPLSWKPVTLDEFTYLNISGRNMNLDVNPDSDRMQFWEKAYEKYAALQD